MLRVLAMIGAGALLALAACSGGEDGKPISTLSEEEQASAATVAAVETISAQPFPTPPVFDVEAIDSAIAAIRSGDPEAVLGQLFTTTIVCVLGVSGFRPPPSCEGVTEDTLDDVFPVSNCDFRYVPRATAEQHIRLWLEAGTGPEVEGVYHVQKSSFAGLYRTHEQPQFAVVLRSVLTDRVAGWVLTFTDDGLIGFGTGCFRTPEEVLEVWAFEGSVIPESQITPTVTPTPLPTPPLTGIASIDAAIKAILADDGAALVAQMRMTSLFCEATPIGLQPHPGCESAPAGTLTEGFPISSCEGRYAEREFAEPLVTGYAGQEVHSVFAFPGTRLHSFLSEAQADYILIVQRHIDGQANASGLLLNSGGVVGQVGGCQQTPAQAIESWELTDPIIPPPQDR